MADEACPGHDSPVRLPFALPLDTEWNKMATIRSRQKSCLSLLGQVPAPLVLRVARGEHAGKVLQLQAAKCTIGSHPEATLRLVAAGLRPVHCLILRGEQGTFVRQWSRDTLVNGAGFEVQQLQRGDRLDIGHVALDVLDAPSSAALTPQQPNHQNASSPDHPVQEAEAHIAELQVTITQLREELLRAQDDLRRAEARGVERDQALAIANQHAAEWERVAAEQERCQHDVGEQADETALQYECCLEQLNDELAVAQLRLSDWKRESNRHVTPIVEAEQQSGHVPDCANPTPEHAVAKSSGELSELEFQLHSLQQQLADSQRRAEQAEKAFQETEAELQTASEIRDRLNRELENDRTTHQQACNEWYADREGLQQQLVEQSESLHQQRMQHHELMSEAERLILSLQHEGKQLLSQLSEAKQTIRQNIEERKAMEAAARQQETAGMAADASSPGVNLVADQPESQQDDRDVHAYVQRLLGRSDKDPE